MQNELKIGSLVKLINCNDSVGTILEINNKKITVECKDMIIKVFKSDILLLKKAEIDAFNHINPNIKITKPSNIDIDEISNFSTEISNNDIILYPLYSDISG